MGLPVTADKLIVGEHYMLKTYFTSEPVEVIYVRMEESAGGKTYTFRESVGSHEHPLGLEAVQEQVSTI
jgi:hypothetical protein